MTTLKCSLRKCSRVDLSYTEARIEVQCSKPSGGIKRAASVVDWSPEGSALFHPSCWDGVISSARARVKKNKLYPEMTDKEKVMVMEASKTQEKHDSEEVMETEAKRIADMIRSAKHCVCFTGAGLSTAAGIGDYRGKSGKWTQMDQEKNKEGDEEPPKKKSKQDKTKDNTNDEESDSEEEEEEDGVPYEKLRPTYSHEALKKLMDDGYLKYCISQNGDGLHLLSGIPEDKISELHGNVFVEKCEKCGHRYHRSFYVMDDEASQYYEELSDYGQTSLKKSRHAKQCDLCGLSHRTGRKCEQKTKAGKVCSGHLLDSIINFRDLLEEDIMSRATANAQRCDLMLCLGTTLTVTPASDLVEEGQEPLRIVICNRQKTHMDKVAVKTDDKGQPLGSRVSGDCDRLFRKVMRHLYPGKELLEWEKGREKRMTSYNAFRKTVD